MLILRVTQETKKLSARPEGIKKLCTPRAPFSVGFMYEGVVSYPCFVVRGSLAHT